MKVVTTNQPYSDIIELINKACFIKAEKLSAELDNSQLQNIQDCLLIVKAWLNFGEIYRARKLFDRIPRQNDNIHYSNIEWELSDLEEAEYLGESVYPSGVPIQERWTCIPPCLDKISSKGNTLKYFWPGRIVFIDDAKIVCVFAIPDENKKLVRVELSLDNWKTMFGEHFLIHENNYIVSAFYAEDDCKIFEHDVPLPPWHEEYTAWLKKCIQYIKR